MLAIQRKRVAETMTPTEILKQEHRTIERMLAVLEKICRKLESVETVDSSHLQGIVLCLKSFADRCHHGKEEAYFFPALIHGGMPAEGGPIGIMLQDHAEGRGFINGMTAALAGWKKGSGTGAESFVSNARNYICLLGEHIKKEDEVLFPMADEHLSHEVQDRLSKEFQRVDREIGCAESLEAFHGLSKSINGETPYEQERKRI